MQENTMIIINDNKELLQQALDALTAMQIEAAARSCGLLIADEAIDALRAAIVQSVQPTPSSEKGCSINTINALTTEIYNALNHHCVHDVLFILTSPLVELSEELVRQRGGDFDKQILIQGNDGRDITIHAKKEGA